MNNLQGSIHASFWDLLVLVKTALSDKKVKNLLEWVKCLHVCCPADDLSDCDSIESLICNNGTLWGITVFNLERFLLNYLHFLIIELDHVIHDKVKSSLEDFHCSNKTSYWVIKDIGVLRSQVVKNVVCLVLFSQIEGTLTQNKAILIPQFPGEFTAFLVVLEDPDLGRKPHRATERKLIFKQFFHEDDARNWLVLKNTL